MIRGQVFLVGFTGVVVVVFVEDDVLLLEEFEVVVDDIDREGVLKMGEVAHGIDDVSVGLSQTFGGDLASGSPEERLGHI